MRFFLQLLAVTASLTVIAEPLPWWLLGLVGFAVLWHVNLFNFMDSIDGYAGSQCVFFALSAHLLVSCGLGWSGWLLGLLVGCGIGFLVYNWPRAKLFMGDVGSATLGLVIAILVAHLWLTSQLPLIASLILLAGFWFDATYTLCVRIITGQAYTQAHRSHLYQHLAVRHGHSVVTLLFWLHGVVWLLPLAWLSHTYSEFGPYLLLLAVAPLAYACWRFQAGQPKRNTAR